ncbi:EGF-like and EMI domain-containing protein 1 [Protopterus annectens]|uniref:EGF-like and EMI domain-containing protein 1 n=1 Tax=Protopterus annectens TaxID=7888 RepID=UPI001CFC3003|nr:EGF-like and EMI domain-containing protein 1 [Protopterus annectens]
MELQTWCVAMCLLGVTVGGTDGKVTGTNLLPSMPNVCAEEKLVVVGHKQPCVQPFTRIVKVWKQGCTGRQMWCVGYERRTSYYTTYKHVYSTEYQTVFKCCPGWSQLSGETGCLSHVCSNGFCFNGGQCTEGTSQLCHCPSGFHGPRCQYGELKLILI